MKASTRATYAVGFTSATHAIAVGAGSVIVPTDNAGKNWTLVKNSKKIKTIKLLDFADAKNGFLTDQNGELWTTSSGGKTWSQQSPFLNKNPVSTLLAVLARQTNAKGGTKWIRQTATVSLGGTFTTTWKVSKATIFVARWAGDATHGADGADPVIVKLKKKK